MEEKAVTAMANKVKEAEAHKAKVAEDKKLSYSQLEMIAKQFRMRAMMAEEKLSQIDLLTIRLSQLFNVLKFKEVFPSEFVDKCSKEVMELMTVEDSAKDE